MIYFTTDLISSLQKSPSPTGFEAILKQNNISQPGITMLIKNSFTFSTLHQLSIQQIETFINLILNLVFEIPKLSTTKDEFAHSYKQKIGKLATRIQGNLNSQFTHEQTIQIYKFCQKQILAYYEFYEYTLDSNTQFTLQTQILSPIPSAKQITIQEGKVVDPETIEVLKKYLGQRQPVKQQKKDVKKK